jgi:hypothetical protein
MATRTFSPPLSLPVPPQHYSVIAVSAAHRDHRRGLRAADPAFDAYCRALETATQAPKTEAPNIVHDKHHGSANSLL